MIKSQLALDKGREVKPAETGWLSVWYVKAPPNSSAEFEPIDVQGDFRTQNCRFVQAMTPRFPQHPSTSSSWPYLLDLLVPQKRKFRSCCASCEILGWALRIRLPSIKPSFWISTHLLFLNHFFTSSACFSTARITNVQLLQLCLERHISLVIASLLLNMSL